MMKHDLFNLSFNIVIDFEFYDHMNKRYIKIYLLRIFLFYIIYIIEMTYLNFYMM